MNMTANDIVFHLMSFFPDALAIYQFGSVGMGNEHKESDLDLAVLSSQRLDPLIRWEAAQKMATIVGRDVDLIDLLSVSTVMRLQVITQGKCLYCRDKNQLGRFENNVFSAYARLNEERRGIMQDIQQKGSVYGR
ncbi:MAG: nucleotidyltransferase domain-containing protein [Nitrospirota bacterium]